MGHFSRSLVRVRTVRGFRTAYAFYHDNGGRRVFPFTYAYYKKLERGGGLPRPAWLYGLLRSLRLDVRDAECVKLVRDYLRDLCADETAYESLFAPLISIPREESERRIVRTMLGRLSYHVTPAQYEVVVSSAEACGAFMLLTNTGGTVAAEDIAAALRRPEAACRAALKRLERAKLVRSFANGYASALSGKNYILPTDERSERLRGKMRDYLRELARGRGKSLLTSGSVVRLDPEALDAALRGFGSVFDKANGQAQSLTDDDGDAGVYLLETRVDRLF